MSKLTFKQYIKEISDKKADDYADKARTSIDTKGQKADSTRRRYRGLGHYLKRSLRKNTAGGNKAQQEYDGPNRHGKSASDGVRYTGD